MSLPAVLWVASGMSGNVERLVHIWKMSVMCFVHSGFVVDRAVSHKNKTVLVTSCNDYC